MGGVDKGLQPFRGEPLVAAVARRFAPQVDRLVISTRDADRYTAFGVVLPDLLGESAGPLAGIHAALTACTTELLAVVPCDAPFAPPDLVERLVAPLADATVEIAFATTAERRHPVFCAMRRSLLPALARYLEDGGRAVGGFIASRAWRAVSFADEAAFRNLNTLDDLRGAERQ